MLNQDEFIDRLHKLFNQYGLSAATFADEIKVQRSSISHLLSGRNKPSLEFVLKITATYKEVTLDWLVHGKGSFPKKENTPSNNNTLFSGIEEKKINITSKPQLDKNEDIKKTTPSEIERIVIFYRNGTFKEYAES